MKDQADQYEIALYANNDETLPSVIGYGYTLQQAKDNLWEKIKANNSYYGTPCVSLQEWMNSPGWDDNYEVETSAYYYDKKGFV